MMTTHIHKVAVTLTTTTHTVAVVLTTTHTQGGGCVDNNNTYTG